MCLEAKDHRFRTFAQTSCSLEEISLRFLDSNHKDSLLIYLRAKLGTYNTPDLRAQKLLLCTWITEIFLDLINDYGVFMSFLWWMA